jgi:hypothetical protein
MSFQSCFRQSLLTALAIQTILLQLLHCYQSLLQLVLLAQD